MIPVSPNGTTREPNEFVGSASRTFNGGLRTTVRAEKRVWSVATGLMTQADMDTLTAAIALAAHVACSGTALGGSVTCEVTLQRAAYVAVNAGDGNGFMRQLSLTLREV
jgi:hypothetical protein